VCSAQIRLAREDEFAALALLRWHWSTGENGATPVVDEAEFVRSFTAWAKANTATHRCFVAELDDRLIGMAWLAINPRVPSPTRIIRSFADIQSVYVLPEHRNSGVGARLIEAISTAAVQLGAERITVHSTEASVDFYRREGFITAETVRHRRI
jgi:GNAT superfamily N-acetyltransferase